MQIASPRYTHAVSMSFAAWPGTSAPHAAAAAYISVASWVLLATWWLIALAINYNETHGISSQILSAVELSK